MTIVQEGLVFGFTVMVSIALIFFGIWWTGYHLWNFYLNFRNPWRRTEQLLK